MARLLDRLRGKDGPEILRGMTLDQYLAKVIAGGMQGYSAPTTYYTAQGQPAERLQADFGTYAQDIYAAHPVIFGLMEARRLAFSEARFCWRAVKNGNPGDVLPISDGLELLNNPWPGAQSGTLISHMRQDSDLGGTAYVVRQRDRLRRLRPDWVYVVLSGDPWTDPFVDFMGITYAPNGPDGSPVEAFLPDEVALWAPIPDPLAQFRGMSWLTPVMREIDADNAATTHRKSTLERGAWLGPVATPPVGTTLEQFKRFVEAADARHAGPNNAGRFVFLAPGSEIKTVAQSLRDLDMKAITGATETRIAAASRVPAVIAQISEGLQGSSLNTGNYGAAKRMWIDGSLRPDWRSLCEALSVITPPPDLSGIKDLEPGTEAQLWILENDIGLLHEDRLDAANVRQANATTINTLVTAGFTPESIVVAVRDDDLSALKHSGLTSVQLVPPGQSMPGAPGQPAEGGSDGGGEDFTAALRELRAGDSETARAQILRARTEHTGAMVALVPSDVDAARLALAGGEPVDELHLTLFYLGDAADIPSKTQREIQAQIQTAVERRDVAAVPGTVFGAALWNPKGDEPAAVLSVGDPPDAAGGLAKVRALVENAIAEAGLEPPEQHSPWAPHVCVRYGAPLPPAAVKARVGPVVFDRLRVAFGGTVLDIPLGGEVGRATGSWSRHPHPGQRFKHGWRPLYPTELLDDALEPEVGDDESDDGFDPRTGTFSGERPELEAEADALLAGPDGPSAGDVDRWAMDNVPGLVVQFLPHLPGVEASPTLNRQVLGRVLLGLDGLDPATVDGRTLGDLVWQALWELTQTSRSRRPFVDRARRRIPQYDGSVPPNGVAGDGTKYEHPAPPRPRKVAAAKPPVQPRRKLTRAEHDRLADDYAAARISKAELRRYLQANPGAARVLDEYRKGRVSRADANAALDATVTDEQLSSVPYGEAFLRSLLLADEAAQHANAGDREGLEAYLRRQNTAALMFMGQGHYGLAWDRRRRYSHDEVVARVAEAVWRAEGPAALGTAAKSRAKDTGRGVPKIPSKSALMRRSKADLQRDAVRAGVSPDGTKAEIVERLLAALRAALPEG